MVIAALAGRRIDAPGADVERFPAGHEADVRGRIGQLLADRHVTVLVCAAACGADLVALDVAGDLGLRRRVVLPFSPARFRETSVIDRPGRWGELFDRIIAAVESRGDLFVLGSKDSEDAAYAAANQAILDQAEDVARQCSDRPHDQNGLAGAVVRPVLAVAVWEGVSHGEGDMTADFVTDAAARGLTVVDVLTR
jgi:hypothetical protein